MDAKNPFPWRRQEAAHKSKTPRPKSGRTFLQGISYHKMEFCQAKTSFLVKIFLPACFQSLGKPKITEGESSSLRSVRTANALATGEARSFIWFPVAKASWSSRGCVNNPQILGTRTPPTTKRPLQNPDGC